MDRAQTADPLRKRFAADTDPSNEGIGNGMQKTTKQTLGGNAGGLAALGSGFQKLPRTSRIRMVGA